MGDSIRPEHYEGPFECIELSRLLTSDWGQVVQYCFRWRSKNGVEDLEKAAWFARDAIMHGIPVMPDDDHAAREARALLKALARVDWMGLRGVWVALAENSPWYALRLLERNLAGSGENGERPSEGGRS